MRAVAASSTTISSSSTPLHMAAICLRIAKGSETTFGNWRLEDLRCSFKISSNKRPLPGRPAMMAVVSSRITSGKAAIVDRRWYLGFISNIDLAISLLMTISERAGKPLLVTVHIPRKSREKCCDIENWFSGSPRKLKIRFSVLCAEWKEIRRSREEALIEGRARPSNTSRKLWGKSFLNNSEGKGTRCCKLERGGKVIHVLQLLLCMVVVVYSDATVWWRECLRL